MHLCRHDYVLRTSIKVCLGHTADFVWSNFDQDDIENIQINSLTDLDCFVAERFNLPLRLNRYQGSFGTGCVEFRKL